VSEVVETPVVPSREQVEKLQATMVGMPQAKLTTEHYFSGGMYCRKVFRPAGTLIVGKVHLKDHFFLCAAGEIIAWTETGMRRLGPGDIVESKPGTKRVTLALTDAIGITVHKTDHTDLAQIETELIEPDDTALFDAHNNLKNAQVEHSIEALP
jgi:quercetin dioxygenase-like cupin family protein